MSVETLAPAGARASVDLGGAGGRVPAALVLLVADVVTLLATTRLSSAPSEANLPQAALVAAVAAGAFAVAGLYGDRRTQPSSQTLDEAGPVLGALFATALALLALAEVAGLKSHTPLRAFGIVAVAGASVLFVRGIMRTIAIPRLTAPRRALILGSDLRAVEIERALRDNDGLSPDEIKRLPKEQVQHYRAMADSLR